MRMADARARRAMMAAGRGRSDYLIGSHFLLSELYCTIVS